MTSNACYTVQIFETWQVTDILVGIPPKYLNMFLQRKLYGITARISGRRGEKNSRRFDTAEVFGIGLAWMLFQSGLRTEPIRKILCEIAETKVANAREAAQVLGQAQLRYLAIFRDLNQEGNTGDSVSVGGAQWLEELKETLRDDALTSALVLPVGAVFDGIGQRMDVLQGVERGGYPSPTTWLSSLLPRHL